MIDLLRRDEGLSRRFPLALSEGAEGEFCNWLCSEGIVRYGLPQGGCSDNPRRIRFPAGLSGQPVDRLSGTRESAFSDRPYAQPARRAGHLAFPTWEQTRHLQPASLVVLARNAEDPIRELVRVYITNPAWQKHFPDAMSPPGWKRLTHWLRERYSLDATGCDYQSHSPLRPIEEFQAAYRSRLAQGNSLPHDVKGDMGIPLLLVGSESEFGRETEGMAPWLDRVRSDISANAIERTGLNILGHFSTPFGLQASAISIVKSLQLVGIDSSCRDVLTEPQPLDYWTDRNTLALKSST